MADSSERTGAWGDPDGTTGFARGGDRSTMRVTTRERQYQIQVDVSHHGPGPDGADRQPHLPH